MHPFADPANRPRPPPPLPVQPPSHRSWTRDPVPLSSHSPNTRFPRSASFSSSRSSNFRNWNDPPPPPPLPPRPPALLPGFQSPQLVHSNHDLFFAETARPITSQSQQPFHPPIADPRYPQSFVQPPSNPMPTPVVPAHPTHAISYANPVGLGASARPIHYARPSPPPAVPQRPSTAHGAMQSFGSTSPPPVPPKPFEFPPPTASQNPALPPKSHLESSKPATDWHPSIDEDRNIQQAQTESRAQHWPHTDSDRSISRDPDDGSSIHPEQVPSLLPEPGGKALPPLAEATSREAEAGTRRFQKEQEDEAALRRLMEEEERRIAQEKREMEQRDEEMARQHAENEARALEEEERRIAQEKREIEQRDQEMARQQAENEARALEEEEMRAAKEKRELERKDEEIARRQAEDEAQALEEEERRAAQEKREMERKDEEMARRQAEDEAQALEEEKRRAAQEKREMEQRDEEMARQQAEDEARVLAEERKVQEQSDAMMARMLAHTTRAGPSVMLVQRPGVNSPPAPESMPAPQYTPPTSTPGPANGHLPSQPPQYDVVVVPSGNTASRGRGRPRIVRASVQRPLYPNALTPQGVRGHGSNTVPPPAAPPQERVQSSRASTVDAGVIAQAGTQSPPANAIAVQAGSQHVPKEVPGPLTAAGPSTMPGPSAVPNPSLPPKGRPEGNNAEQERFRGVSYGFGPPQIHPRQMICQPMPEVIILHPARALSFHIITLSWRHLMRLLAQLETRIQPSIGAIAQAKEHLLRVVVHFVKPMHDVEEWRTIIHLSIDQPLPPNTPQPWRFKNGDTTVLPYAIAPDGVPPHLMASAVSQLYVVPLSPTTPFPILPLSLSNLALYLQSAMRDSRSRKVQNDTSNTMRRLALMVNSCYPDEAPRTDTEVDSERGVGGILKRVVGRGKRRDTHGNEDVYDMVTPFRIDKYTTLTPDH